MADPQHNYSNTVKELFLVLNEKEQKIITKRFSLDNKMRLTLERIGQDYNITRERVRQIEKTAISKLRRTSVKTNLIDLFKVTIEILNKEGYILSEKKLNKLVQSKFPNSDSHFITLSFEINPELEKIKKSKDFIKTWYIIDRISKKEIQNINKTAIKLLKSSKEIIAESNFLKQVQDTLGNKNYSKNSISAAINANVNIKLVQEGYGLTAWRDVKPRSIKDKALIVLKRKGKPLHFRKLTEAISTQGFDNKSVTTQAVHNELIRYEDFVLVGRGIYALKTWGFKKGTVKDVIYDILKESGALKKREIIEKVLERRQVKTGTISLNLQKYPEFKRIGRAVYTI